jgi:peptidoglycan-associated lipoprotein
MRLSLSITAGLAVILVAAACGGGGQPQVAVGPDPDSIAREQRIRDSIAAAERARRDSIARAEEARRRARADSIASARAETEAVLAMVAERIHFDFDRSNIRPGEDTGILEQKLRVLQANPGLQVEIVGHCDERGSDEYNLALGQRRSLSAKQFLVDRGINPDRISVRSMGEEQPIDMGHDEDAWAQNRRDEFIVIAGGDQLSRPPGM